MGASAVVVLDELSQYPLQMTSAEDQQRYPGCWPQGVASIIWRHTQAAVG